MNDDWSLEPPARQGLAVLPFKQMALALLRRRLEADNGAKLQAVGLAFIVRGVTVGSEKIL